MDISYFRAIQGAVGADSEQDVLIREAKDNLALGMQGSIGNAKIKRNGHYQNFVVSKTQVNYKYQISAFPDEELYIGDIIDYNGEKWIVAETRIGSPLQTVGIMWLCNIELAFQNGTKDVIKRPAVLDAGVYSTTKNGNDEIQYVDKQFKLYLPYDEDTKRLFVDKRIAVDKRYDQHGQEILEVYDITGINRVAKNYGKGSHLLTCELRSGVYSPSNDNLELMICDYIEGGDIPPTEKLKCSISGRPTITVGSYRIYTPLFYDSQDQEVDDVEPLWNVESDIEVVTEQIDKKLKVFVPNNEDYIGETIQVILTGTNDLYEPFVFEAEVVE